MKPFDFSLSYDDRLSLLTVVTHGKFAVEANEKMIRAVVSHPRWPQCTRLLANHMDSHAGHQTRDEVIRIAELTAYYFDDHWPKKFAVVMDGDDSLDCGNATLWSVVSNAAALTDIQIFSDPEQAMAWLKDAL